MDLSSLLFYIFLVLLSVLVYCIHQRLNYFKNAGIAFEPPSLLFGNMQGVRSTRSFAEIFQQFYFKFKGTGPFAGFFFFQKPSAFILDIELMKNILIKDFAKFADRGFFHNEKDDPLTGQLTRLDGQKWRHMRNKLSPTFSSGKMKYMFPTVLKVGEEFVKVFGSMVKQSAVVEVKEVLARFTTDVIGTCAFGIDCNSLKDPNAEFRIMGRKAMTDSRNNVLVLGLINSFPNLARKLGMKQTPDHIEEFFLRIVRENVEYREQHGIRRKDFMDLLIELKNKKLMKSEIGQNRTNLTLEEIAAQTFIFFIAGFETSSTTMGYVIYELAQNEAVQQKAREEVQQVLAKYHQEFSYECMKELQYLDQVISETLRMYSIVPMLNRQAVVDYVVPGNPKYVIHKGMSVIIPAAALHHDPDYYPNPNKFDPDRFSPEMVKDRDSMHWLPFGEGPRNCIGLRFGQMQMRIGLALLLKNFKFTTCKETQIPLRYEVKSFLKSTKDGIYVRAEALLCKSSL